MSTDKLKIAQAISKELKGKVVDIVNSITELTKTNGNKKYTEHIILPVKENETIQVKHNNHPSSFTEHYPISILDYPDDNLKEHINDLYNSTIELYKQYYKEHYSIEKLTVITWLEYYKRRYQGDLIEDIQKYDVKVVIGYDQYNIKYPWKINSEDKNFAPTIIVTSSKTRFQINHASQYNHYLRDVALTEHDIAINKFVIVDTLSTEDLVNIFNSL